MKTHLKFTGLSFGNPSACGREKLLPVDEKEFYNTPKPRRCKHCELSDFLLSDFVKTGLVRTQKEIIF